jgi:hypothetical protein
MPLKLGEVLVEAGREMPMVYFPSSGIILSIVNFKEGERIEVSMIGRDGVCGAAAVLSGDYSPSAAIVQFPGKATVISSGIIKPSRRHQVERTGIGRDQSWKRARPER